MAAIRRFPGASALVVGASAILLHAVGARALGERVSQSPRDEKAVIRQMHENFSRIGAIELAIIRGDLEDVPPSARWLQDNITSKGFPPATEPVVARLRTAAKRASEATDLSSAAGAAADLLAACGGCHVAAHAEVTMTSAPKPPESQGTAAQMRQHNWAVELLSLGLVEPSDALWKEGANSLQSLTLVPPTLPPDPSHVAQMRDLEAQVRQLAGKALQARTPDERAPLYGQVIATCGTCHGLNGIVLGPGITVD